MKKKAVKKEVGKFSQLAPHVRVLQNAFKQFKSVGGTSIS